MMDLDTLQLDIVIVGDNEMLNHTAGVILPVREEGGISLCTLLLSNMTVNILLNIIMADITNETIGFLMSTGLVRIFIL